MARPHLRLATNAPGPFCVDGSSIDCGTGWPWAPQSLASQRDLAKGWLLPGHGSRGSCGRGAWSTRCERTLALRRSR